VQLGPGMNVARVPNNGRNFEYMSGEDPLLGSVMVPAAIAGIQSQGVIANAKHFVNNNQETNRYGVNAIVDERSMMEIYMPPFESAVSNGVGSIMCSYNRITASTYTTADNSSWACENGDTLQTILKERFGFEGWVMSDWDATHSTEKAALNGLDQEMPEGVYFGPMLENAVNNGTIAESVIDDKVLRILTPMINLGVYDNVLPYGVRENNVSTSSSLQVARNLSSAATVLLKNDDSILPLSSSDMLNIVVIGPAASLSPIVAGTGSGAVSPAGGIVSALQGINEVVSSSNSGSSVIYINGTQFEEDNDASFSSDETDLIQNADIVIIVVGVNSGEGRDRSTLSLGNGQDEMISSAAEINSNSIVVASNPGAILMSSWTDQVKAVLLMFMPGQEMGHGLSDVLFGDVNPSARLPLTMPRIENEVNFTQDQYPGILDPNPHPKECQIIDGPCRQATYSEGLLVGYRWYHAMNVANTHNKETSSSGVEPLFVFGHGLSYTSFQYDNLVIDTSSSSIMVSFDLTNIGLYSGSEVSQLYLSYPMTNDMNGQDTNEPPMQLKGFHKTFLEPQESMNIQFELSERSLSIWDIDVHDWTEISGVFSVAIGASSADLRLSGAFQN
jgi:beta-glucosidase